MIERWPEEHVDALRKMVAQGLKSSQIAARLPYSRNAVIGKAGRLGLHIGSGQRGGAHKKADAQRPKPARKATSGQAKPAARKIPPHIPYVPREPAPSVPPTPLEDRQPGQCAWPVNSDKPYLYCGNQRQPGKRRSGKVREYCEAHERLYVASEAWL